MKNEVSFRAALSTVWFRLMSLGILGLAFAETLRLSRGSAQGWSYYLTGPELTFEIVLRVIVAGLIGMALGTAAAILVTPFLWYFQAARERLSEWTVGLGIFVVLFFDSRLALVTLVKSVNRGVRFIPLLLKIQIVVFVLALLIARSRRELAKSLDPFLGKKVSRRMALATVASAGALVATEFALGRKASIVRAALVPDRPESNILLITFDALDAEDLSLYGYKLPTTPNIDAFARRASVFTNYYAASTFTTPCIATMLTGLYPSESHVYHLQGTVRAENVQKSLPHLMHAAGFRTAAFASNPFAYYLATSLKSEYDILPEPIFQQGGLDRLWNATRPLHQDVGFGRRIDEYFDLENLWNSVGGMAPNLSMRYRPRETFQHAREMIAKLPQGYFLWVHAITPHNPYLPDPADHGRFLPNSQLHTYEEEYGDRWQPHYEPDQQDQVDQRHLRYDEFVATADRAFGSFINDLDSSGKLQNTTVIVSADHGESFQGGVYQHSSPYLTRPVIHVPLIIRTPGQQESRAISVTADQTSLAPTILEIAGQPKPDWMSGQSLVRWLKSSDNGHDQGRAFCQYLETSSVFRPARRGTVGVIEGNFQYLVDISTQKGSLRPLAEAHVWNRDRSAEYPERAAALRAVLVARFPELVGKYS
jgi:arylsulfatase A-like enzyme